MSDYPIPDRSKVKRNFTKSPENDVLDLAWAAGRLADGRPFRAECWAQDQLTMLTFFFSTRGIEAANQQFLKQLLVENGLVVFSGQQQFTEGAIWVDAKGHDMWSVNVVVGADEDLFVQDSIALSKYNDPSVTRRAIGSDPPGVWSGDRISSPCCNAPVLADSTPDKFLVRVEVDAMAGGGGPLSVWLHGASGWKWEGTTDDIMATTCNQCQVALGTTAGALIKILWRRS